MTHENTVFMVGGIPKRIPTRVENEFLLKVEEVEKNIEPKTVAPVTVNG